MEAFKNIRDAERNKRESENRQSRADALKALASVEPYPPNGVEAASSNIVGVLKRVAQEKQSGSLYILITDLADSRFKTLPHLDAPAAAVGTVVIVVPSKPKDTILTLGRNFSGDEQFTIRSEQLKQAAPWASAVPFFQRDLVAVIKSTALAAAAAHASGARGGV